MTPTLHEGVVRLGACVPFAQVGPLVAHFTGVAVPEATARRLTEAAGAAYVAVQTAEAARLEREAPAPAQGPAVQQVSVDGAMVPLRRGEWAEVKTLAIGTVTTEIAPDGEPLVRTEELSYFSRLAESDAFTRLARVETERRGTETAGLVAGVVDGAVWCQSFFDAHRPDAVRILDFPHAVEHLTLAAQAVFGTGATAQEWLRAQARRLKEEGPTPVLAAVGALAPVGAPDPVAAERTRDEVLGYLEKRRDQLRYPAFAARGLPVGSGAVESANKVVVEARLKGAGMRWARDRVNPMVALRTAICGGPWAAAWPAIAGQLRAQGHRSQPRTVAAPAAAPVAPPLALAEEERPGATPEPAAADGRPKRVVDGRPTLSHPWKRYRAVA